ncbi:MAG TPA: restriction endonuclease subunit S, partial [Patescibacteria group bacterium]|nr:restriction endonuclease subunit S [Patescibacteria group bacterium]
MTNNWPKKLGEVADILMGQSPPSSTYNNEGVGLPFFQGKAEFGDLYPKVDRYCSVPVRIAENRDILLSVRAPVGPINIAQEKTCIGRGLSAIRAKKEQANQWYLYYLLKQHEDNWEGSSGSTFQAINKTTIENLQIPLPNLNAQKIIVERLDVIRKAQELCDTQ